MPRGVYIRTEKTKQALSDAHKGIPLSIEHRLSLSKSRKGRVISEEHRMKLSEANKGKHNKIPELVYHHTKYKEIHGVDEGKFLTVSEHRLLHRRLRKEGKCNVPVPELSRISNSAYKRRVSELERLNV